MEQRQYADERGSSMGSEEERGQFKELSMFFAEMFYRVRVEKGKVCYLSYQQIAHLIHYS